MSYSSFKILFECQLPCLPVTLYMYYQCRNISLFCRYSFIVCQRSTRAPRSSTQSLSQIAPGRAQVSYLINCTGMISVHSKFMSFRRSDDNLIWKQGHCRFNQLSLNEIILKKGGPLTQYGWCPYRIRRCRSIKRQMENTVTRSQRFE